MMLNSKGQKNIGEIVQMKGITKARATREKHSLRVKKVKNYDFFLPLFAFKQKNDNPTEIRLEANFVFLFLKNLDFHFLEKIDCLELISVSRSK